MKKERGGQLTNGWPAPALADAADPAPGTAAPAELGYRVPDPGSRGRRDRIKANHLELDRQSFLFNNCNTEPRIRYLVPFHSPRHDGTSHRQQHGKLAPYQVIALDCGGGLDGRLPFLISSPAAWPARDQATTLRYRIVPNYLRGWPSRPTLALLAARCE